MVAQARGPVAQWLEPTAHNGLVAGSSPARPTSSYMSPSQQRIAPVSHVVRLDRPADKAERYREVAEEIAAVLEGEPNVTARMATVASMLNDAFESYFWTGFY